MGRKRRTALPKKARQIQIRIERWRRTRSKRSPMPEKLWDEAASLARVHGVNRIASELRLSYENLRKRVDGTPKKGRRDDTTGFVELAPSRFEERCEGAQLVGAFESARTEVEFSGADKAKLVIRLSAREDLNILDLAEAFWKRGT